MRQNAYVRQREHNKNKFQDPNTIAVDRNENLFFCLKLLRVSRSYVFMQTVIRTPTFLSDAKAAGLSDDEQNDIVSEISKNPTAGAIMEGTGGCRKLRFAGKGKGKRGGF